MKRVTFKCMGVRYDLVLRGRLTIVVGDTASGKTRLSRLVQLSMADSTLAELAGARSIEAADDTSWLPVLEGDAEIVVVDEDALSKYHNDVVRVLKNYNHLYIVMGRDLPDELPFGLHSMVCISALSSTHYRTVPYEPTPNLFRPALGPAPFVYCEDGKSGFFAAQESYVGTMITAKPLYGKDKDIPVASGYLCLDLCGIGARIFYIEALIRDNINLQLCRVQSFEAEALRAQGVDVDSVLSDTQSYFNVEDMYTDMLDEYLQARGNKPYNKSTASTVRALITGYNAHDKERLNGYRVVKDWWIPGVPHIPQVESVTEFLSLYKDTMGKEFTGTIPACVYTMTVEELRREFPNIMVAGL